MANKGFANWLSALASAVPGDADLLPLVQGGVSKKISVSDIVALGSNANGSYMRFATGGQICWYRWPITGLAPTTYTVQGLTIYRASWGWTFPIGFLVSPVVLANPRLYRAGNPLAAHLGSAYVGGTTDTGTTLIVESLLDFDEVREPSLIAVGQWK